MFLYEVTLPGGKTNQNWGAFFTNVSRLNGKAPDFGGINNVALLKHSMNASVVKNLLMEGFKGRKKELEVYEITTISLGTTHHAIYKDKVENLFLPYDNFPNLPKGHDLDE